MPDTDRTNTCKAIEAAVESIAAYCLDSDEMVTDAVLVIGAQHIDDEGDRVGRVIVFPRHASQPAYITVGLIESARRLVDVASDE